MTKPRYYTEVTEEHAPLIAWARAELQRRADEDASVRSHAEYCRMKIQRDYRRKAMGLTRSMVKFWFAFVQGVPIPPPQEGAPRWQAR